MESMFRWFGIFNAGPVFALRMKALLVGALVMTAVCLALTVWALLERTWRLSSEVKVVRLETQVAVLADSINRQNNGIDETRRAGQAAQADVQELRKAAAALSAAGTRLGNTIEEARRIVAQPAPKRPDGTAKDCTDAWREIDGRAKP